MLCVGSYSPSKHQILQHIIFKWIVVDMVLANTARDHYQPADATAGCPWAARKA